ncbi:hypothetical protein [Alienimonas sp. DA493]|uniref:hypothetical protein n=1 Tax=Alienimonas sp. DA493 TaxID=3373605 RepID=UPI0037540726
MPTDPAPFSAASHIDPHRLAPLRLDELAKLRAELARPVAAPNDGPAAVLVDRATLRALVEAVVSALPPDDRRIVEGAAPDG